MTNTLKQRDTISNDEASAIEVHLVEDLDTPGASTSVSTSSVSPPPPLPPPEPKPKKQRKQVDYVIQSFIMQ